MAVNPGLAVMRLVVAHIGKNCRVGDRLDEARTKNRRRNSEHDVGIAALPRGRIARGGEARLGDGAAAGIGAARHDEEIMYAAIPNAVRHDEASFADGPLSRDEPRDRIRRPEGTRDTDQRILRRTAAARIGLRVAGHARIRVEARTEPVALRDIGAADDLDGLEARQAVVEEIELILPQPRERSRCTVVAGAVAYARIGGLGLRQADWEGERDSGRREQQA